MTKGTELPRGLPLPTYVKALTDKQLKIEFKELDDLIYGEHSCFGVRDLRLHKALADEMKRRDDAARQTVSEGS